MATIRSALPDTTERPACWRCTGDGKRYIRHAGAWHEVDGVCPQCHGSGRSAALQYGQGPDVAEVQQVLAELRRLGFALAEWRFAKVAGAVEERAAIREDIRTVVRRGVRERLTFGEMAETLDISRQHLDNIRREDPTGRNRG